MNCPANAISVESGVGCAYAIVYSALKNSPSVVCGDELCNSEGATGSCGTKKSAGCCGSAQ